MLGMHRLEKFMGPQQRGDKFVQKYKCQECGKLVEKSS